jgi:hypothetical protein
MNENTVQVTRTEFENLLKAKFDLAMVRDVLLNRASLGWTGKYLVWSDETTSDILSYIIGNAYAEKLAELTKEDGE